MQREYVGIDLYRLRSVIHRMDDAGNKLDCVRIEKDPLRFAEEVSGWRRRATLSSQPPTAGCVRKRHMIGRVLALVIASLVCLQLSVRRA
jgi:hypothetical protein